MVSDWLKAAKKVIKTKCKQQQRPEHSYGNVWIGGVVSFKKHRDVADIFNIEIRNNRMGVIKDKDSP